MAATVCGYGCTAAMYNLSCKVHSSTSINFHPAPSPDFNFQEIPMDGQVNKEGKKLDAGKPRWELIPYDAIRGLAEVLTDGAKKYDARNWENGLMYGRVFGAVQRHLTAWWQGEDRDPESGRSHLDHALCEVVFLSAYEKRGMVQFDDRPGFLGAATYLVPRNVNVNVNSVALGQSSVKIENVRPIQG